MPIGATRLVRLKNSQKIGYTLLFMIMGLHCGQQLKRLRPAMRQHPGRVASKWGTPTGADDYICHLLPLPYLARGFFIFRVFRGGRGDSMG